MIALKFALLIAAGLITIWTIGLIVVLSTERQRNNNDRRKDGSGGCNDCNVDWCPCWEIEQKRRRLRYEREREHEAA